MSLPMLPVDNSGTTKPIPERLHQIWIGSEPPAWVRRCWLTWDRFMAEHHPDVVVMRWTDQTVVGSPLEVCQRVGERYGLGPRGVADLMRVRAVALLGGVYFDTDTIPLRPLNDYFGERSPWIGSAPRTRDSVTLANASFGFPAGHPFLADVWAHAGTALQRGVTNDHSVSGPRTWRRVMDTGLHPDIEVDYRFENEIDDSRIQRTIGTGAEFDLDELRERYTGTPVLHVVFTAARYR